MSESDIKVTNELDGTYTIEAMTEAGVKFIEKQICPTVVSVNVTNWRTALQYIVAARSWDLKVNDRGNLIG